VAVSIAVGNHPVLVGMTGTIVATAMACVTFLTLYGGRAETLAHARQTSAILVSIIANDLALNTARFDLSIKAMVDGAAQPATWTLPKELRQRALFDRAIEAPYLRGAFIVDASGHLMASQSDGIEPAIEPGDRDYFAVLQRDAAAKLFVSRPYHTPGTPADGGRMVIAMARRIDRPDGSFAGVAFLRVEAEYFRQLLERIQTGPSGAAGIVLDDGTVLARKPSGAGSATDLTGASFSMPAEVSRRAEGSLIVRSKTDGVERIYTFAHVAGTPLIAVVAPALDDVLADWRRRTLVAGMLTIAFGASVVIVSWLLAFVLRDRVGVQAELEKLASTDPLTGLSNRRTLDSRLGQEWQRARRESKPISALFIDIDRFKLFNDMYGHATGDEVLAAVAECIGSAVRRSVDIAARYGGEEFAVVLPDTRLDDAAKLAEKIRRKVQSMNLVHDKSEHGSVTVSIGCATSVPAEGVRPADLMIAADAQLYAAKAAGRNRVVSVLAEGAFSGMHP
jgi:diguanylate cyclase (GGDEF)-like protein